MINKNERQDLYLYCESYSSQHDAILAELFRETHLKALKPRMASGPLQGRILSFISRIANPAYILEIGTFTGYATLCLAEGLAKNGKILTIEVNKELGYISNKYFERSPLQSAIKPIVGDALELIPELEDGIDIVFIDGRKQDYIKYYNLLINKIKSGGIILADNILWDGKVIQEKKDKTTQAIHEFNELVLSDTRVRNVILPLRDGINIIVKK